ncbi:MAG TPA: hypothetical protein DGT23_13795, partial [Micromonosporaceae bacterium]|nr:hypothetical protein [Micromonosporaceae bacterium]
MEPTPTPTGVGASPEPKKGTAVCTIADKNAIELSGLALAKGFIYVANDGTETAARERVFKLNGSTCALVGQPLAYPGQGPADPEDLAIGPDGTIWIADIGDNDKKRPTVALWKIVEDKIDGPYRLAYPEGQKHDAEALLIGSDGLPIIVTKPLSGPGKIFIASAAPDKTSTSGVPLKAAGEVTLPKTQTENPMTVAGRTMITGAAMSPDKTRVVLRTYADAFEWT